MVTQTLRDAYDTFTPGSMGFAQVVANSCGYQLMIEQAVAIGERAATPEEFDRIWSNEAWWLDVEIQ